MELSPSACAFGLRSSHLFKSSHVPSTYRSFPTTLQRPEIPKLLIDGQNTRSSERNLSTKEGHCAYASAYILASKFTGCKIIGCIPLPHSHPMLDNMKKNSVLFSLANYFRSGIKVNCGDSSEHCMKVIVCFFFFFPTQNAWTQVYKLSKAS